MDVIQRTSFVAAENCVACAFGDGIAVLDLRSNQYFTLNPVAAVVWAGLEKASTAEALIDRVLDTFDVDRTTCEMDITALLADLTRAGLVVAK